MSQRLDITDLTSGYGRIDVLHDLSLSVGVHGNVGLFGPNGHGKTTLLRTVSGLIKPSKGSIAFNGVELSTLTPRAIVELGLIHVSQGNRLFPDLTIGECLSLGALPRQRVGRRKQAGMRSCGFFQSSVSVGDRKCALCRVVSVRWSPSEQH
jgi:branched-chain amino acid transport system ATP-binding protein